MKRPKTFPTLVPIVLGEHPGVEIDDHELDHTPRAAWIELYDLRETVAFQDRLIVALGGACVLLLTACVFACALLNMEIHR